MARTKQTARKTTGRLQVAQKVPKRSTTVSVVRSLARIRNDTGHDYPCDVRGLNNKYPEWAEVYFPGAHYIHLSQLTRDEDEILPLLEDKKDGYWVQEEIDAQQTSRSCILKYHCGYCHTGFTRRDAANRHSFGRSNRQDCKKRPTDKGIIKNPFKCTGLSSCAGCLHPFCGPKPIHESIARREEKKERAAAAREGKKNHGTEGENDEQEEEHDGSSNTDAEEAHVSQQPDGSDPGAGPSSTRHASDLMSDVSSSAGHSDEDTGSKDKRKVSKRNKT